MSDYRIKLTIDETRHLFHTMMQTMRKECEAEYSDMADVSLSLDANAAKGASFDEAWKTVESELRKAYELCRFAMNVQDLEEHTNLDIFRGNCEDINGIDPVDDTLFTKISHEIVDINKALEMRAAYRSKIPSSIETLFMNHVKDRREYFDSILTASSVSTPNKDPLPELPKSRLHDFPPQDLGILTQELVSRLTALKNQAELLVPRDET